MTVTAKSLQSVPVAVTASILLAGIMWYTSATNSLDLSSDNVYFRPAVSDCGNAADAGGYMTHWMRP